MSEGQQTTFTFPTFTFPGTSITLNRMGYGAMQLAGPHVWGHREIKAWQPCSPCSEAPSEHRPTSCFDEFRGERLP